MIPLEKVKQIVSTYETLEKELASGDIKKKILLKNLKDILVFEKLLIKLEAIWFLNKKKQNLKKL